VHLWRVVPLGIDPNGSKAPQRLLIFAAGSTFRRIKSIIVWAEERAGRSGVPGPRFQRRNVSVQERRVTENSSPEGHFELAVWRREGQSATVVLDGELDLASAPQLQACLAELTANGVKHVVVDLANLRFIDSTGIGVLVSDFKRLSEVGGSMAVRNAGPRAYRVFEMTGLVELLSVTPPGLDPGSPSSTTRQ
jgi:anti-sigma B factor antagonist